MLVPTESVSYVKDVEHLLYSDVLRVVNAPSTNFTASAAGEFFAIARPVISCKKDLKPTPLPS